MKPYDADEDVDEYCLNRYKFLCFSAPAIIVFTFASCGLFLLSLRTAESGTIHLLSGETRLIALGNEWVGIASQAAPQVQVHLFSGLPSLTSIHVRPRVERKILVGESGVAFTSVFVNAGSVVTVEWEFHLAVTIRIVQGEDKLTAIRNGAVLQPTVAGPLVFQEEQTKAGSHTFTARFSDEYFFAASTVVKGTPGTIFFNGTFLNYDITGADRSCAGICSVPLGEDDLIIVSARQDPEAEYVVDYQLKSSPVLAAVAFFASLFGILFVCCCGNYYQWREEPSCFWGSAWWTPLCCVWKGVTPVLCCCCPSRPEDKYETMDNL